MVSTHLKSIVAVLCCAFAAALPAQIEVDLEDVTESGGQLVPGERAPPPKFSQWVRGEAFTLGGESAPRAALYAFCADPAQLGADADYLADLQRRHADVAVVAVIPAGDFELPAHIAGIRVAVDQDGSTSSEWLGEGWQSRERVVVLSGAGLVAFRGQLGHGAVDAVARTLLGKLAIVGEHKARTVREELTINFDSMVGRAARKLIDDVIAHSPRNGWFLGLSYVTAVSKQLDLELAEAIREAAVDRLANESRPLAVFADVALRGDPGNKQLAAQLAAALVPATAAAPNDTVVQLAYLRALVAAGMGRQVGRHAMMLKKRALARGWTSFEFGEILTHDATPQVHALLCHNALEMAAHHQLDARLRTALRWSVLKLCDEDDAAAQQVLDDYANGLGDRSSINNDCWYMMTELLTMGRFDAFAAGLADKMLEERENMDAFEFDTAALAKFLAGQIDAAVELQEAALQKGAAGNAEYQERLRRYRAAAERARAAAAPSAQKPGK